MGKQKVILHILNSGIYSGAEKVALETMSALSDQYHFIYVSKEGSIRHQVTQMGFTYIGLEKLSIFAIKNLICEYKPILIHAHDFTASIYSAIAAGNCPVISHIHNNTPWLQKRGIRSIAYAVTISAYERILLVSEAVKEEYVFRKKLERKSQVIGNPVKIEVIQAKSECMMEKPNRIYNIVFIGRLSNQKNPLRFIKLISELKKECTIHAAIIGAGELEEECREAIRSCGLEDEIDMLGFVDNPMPILKNSRLLCSTSDWEGYGLVAVEAMAVGVPVVANGVGGLKDLVTEESGKICSSDKDYIEEMKKLLIEPNYYEKKHQGAIERAKQLDNYENYMNNIKECYERIIEK